MKKMMKKFKNERGLTLVELLAVVVILAILAIIAFVFIGGIIDNSKKDAHISNAQQAINAAKLHVTTEGELGTAGITVQELQDRDYLEDVLRNPWDKKNYADLDKVTITNDGTQYKITGFVAKDGSDAKCSITATEEELTTKKRKELCNN